jgi:hypothetical protein
LSKAILEEQALTSENGMLTKELLRLWKKEQNNDQYVGNEL